MNIETTVNKRCKITESEIKALLAHKGIHVPSEVRGCFMELKGSESYVEFRWAESEQK